jgi:hypothetical protein
LYFGSLPWFADLHVHLPEGGRGEQGAAVTVAVTSPSFRKNVPDPAPLPVKLLPTPFPTFPPPISATEVFHDNGDNTKDDNRMTGGVVSKGVVLAGWLMEGMPEANHGVGTRDDETEDYHYDILLDSDFITRTYGSPPLQPLTNAMIPGQSVPLIHIPAPTAVALVYGLRVTSDNFTLPEAAS